MHFNPSILCLITILLKVLHYFKKLKFLIMMFWNLLIPLEFNSIFPILLFCMVVLYCFLSIFDECLEHYLQVVLLPDRQTCRNYTGHGDGNTGLKMP